MPQNKSTQRGIGTILAYASQAIRIIVSLIYTPFMISKLGASEYGVYQLSMSVASYLSVLSLGLGSSYVRFSTIETHKGEDAVKKLNFMYLVIFSILGILAVLASIGISFFAADIIGDNVTSQEISEFKTQIIILGANIAITFVDSVFNNNVIKNERFIFQKTITILSEIFNPIIALPLLLHGYKSTAMVVVITLLNLAKLIVDMTYSIGKLEMRFQASKFDALLFKGVLNFSLFVFLNMIIDRINWSVDKLLLARFIGTTAVAVYSVGSHINTLYCSLSTAISSVYIPKVNQIVASKMENAKEELSELMNRVGRMQFLVLWTVWTGFLIYGKDFIHLWVGSDYERAFYVAVLLITPMTIEMIQTIGVEIQRAYNVHKFRSVVYSIISIINIGISIPLIKLYDVVGASLGTALAVIIGNGIIMNIFYQKKLKLNMFGFWRTILSTAKAYIIPVLIGLLLLNKLPCDSYIKLGGHLIAYVALTIISIYFFGISGQERSKLQSIIRRG